MRNMPYYSEQPALCLRHDPLPVAVMRNIFLFIFCAQLMEGVSVYEQPRC